MRKISVNNSKEPALVSCEDYGFLVEFKWYLHHTGYAYTKIWFAKKRRTVAMHRIILMRESAASLEIDHINRDKLDNRRVNLRMDTWSVNRINRKQQRNNKTGHKGVTWLANKKRFVCWIGGSSGPFGRVYCGQHKTLKAAAMAYNNMAKKLYGKYACLNKI